jgi:hypothetical protein
MNNPKTSIENPMKGDSINLLDEFAGQAMIGMLCSMNAPNFTQVGGKDGIAYHAYDIAVRMLKQRDITFKELQDE